MSGQEYKLIDVDQMEPSRVRRRLRQWETPEAAAAAIVHALQLKGCFPSVRVRLPRYETNVYPLYFYWQYIHHLRHRQVYEAVFNSLQVSHSMPEPELRAHIGHTVDSEVDILVEDVDYFAFIEAKEVTAGRRPKFENKRGVHQLVSQLFQGRILQRLISKPVVLATIGANGGEPFELKLNPAEQALLHLVGIAAERLTVIDLTWPSVS